MQSNLKLRPMAPFTGKPSGLSGLSQCGLSQSLERVGGLNQICLYQFSPHFLLKAALNLSFFCVPIVLRGTSFVVLSCLLLLLLINGP